MQILPILHIGLLDASWERTWPQFGWVLSAKLAPSWHVEPDKTAKRSLQIVMMFKDIRKHHKNPPKGGGLALSWRPSWPPSCPKNRPKSVPRAIQNPSQWAVRFRSGFEAIFKEFCCQVGTPKLLKMELSPRRRAYFAYFAYLLAGRLLGTNLASIWVGFGCQVGTKLAS